MYCLGDLHRGWSVLGPKYAPPLSASQIYSIVELTIMQRGAKILNPSSLLVNK